MPVPAAAIANQFAAMPSLHLAWAAWCAATVFALTRHRWLRILAVCYPVLTAVVVLGTANHYLLDGLAGVGLWAAVQGLAQLAYRSTAAAHASDSASGTNRPLGDIPDTL